MKKSLVLGILGAAAAATAYGQGTVQFQNYFNPSSPTIKYAASNVPSGKANLALGGNFAAELAWFNGVTADPNQLVLIPTTITGFGAVSPSFPNAVADGDLASGAGWYFGPTVTLSGAASGTTVTLDVIAFNGAAPTAFAGGIPVWNGATGQGGQSGLFQITLGGGALPPAGLSSAPNFTVQNVPEPTMFALAGLGAAGLMALRRKKA
jgi:hypothetical protein